MGNWNLLCLSSMHINFSPILYYFPMAAVINYHKLSGLKQYKLVLL